jgi:glycosyltransferase involved in cell wall biosynthesis
MRWLQANTDLQLATLAVESGPLLKDFADLGPVRCLDEWPRFDRVRKLLELITSPAAKPTPPGIRQAAEGILRNAARALSRGLRDCDVLYANSIESALGVRALRDHQPLVSHLHEGAYYLLADPYNDAVQTVVQGADRLIASSSEVRRVLVDDLAVPSSSVAVCYPFIDSRCYPPAADRAALRAELGLPADALVVGMSGHLVWRKAPDVFLAVARETLRRARDQNIVFVWVGGDEESPPFTYLTLDVKRLGLSRRVRFVPHQADPRPYLRAFDLLFLSSRAEVFPLVCLEAGVSAQAPVVCFERGSDATDLVADGCGFVVPYLDIEAAASAILALAADSEMRLRMGTRLAELVRSRHDVTVNAPLIHAVIKQLV